MISNGRTQASGCSVPRSSVPACAHTPSFIRALSSSLSFIMFRVVSMGRLLKIQYRRRWPAIR